jgi:rhodanese-related sulfurtransferase
MRLYCGACILASVVAFGIIAAQPAGESKKIDADELARLLERPGKVFFLDVREPEEIEKLGSVKGYVNIPLSQLEKRLGEVPRNKLIVAL